MKRLIFACLSIALLTVVGCKDDNTEGGGNRTYSITAYPGEGITLEVQPAAKAGAEVIVNATIEGSLKKIVAVTYNAQPCKFVSQQAEVSVYSFVMPAEDVYLEALTDMNFVTINKEEGPHTTLILLNVIDNNEDPREEWTYSQIPGSPINFRYSGDLGFTPSVSVTGDNTGEEVEVTWSDDENSDYGKDFWVAIMPDEPVTIRTVATEKTDFKGKDFVGAYTGYPIVPGAKQLITGDETDFSLELNANTSFFARSTDESDFDFDGCYTFDEATNRFAYDIAYSDDGYGKADYGVSGQWFEEDFAFVFVTDLVEDKAENNRYYFVGKQAFGYICAASNEYTAGNTDFLLETTRGTRKNWYLVERSAKRARKVELQFASGSSIGDASSAIVSADGVKLLRYDLASESGTPVFTYTGREAGTYTGTAGMLELDGLGNLTLGGQSGTYNIAGSVVTAQLGSDTRTFALDMTAKTYTESQAAKWEGPKSFSATVTGGQKVFFAGNSTATTKGEIELYLDSDFGGNEVEGQVKLVVRIDGHEVIATSSGTSYSYDPAANTILVSQVLVGTNSSAGGTERADYLFNVSADKKTLTFAEHKQLRSTTTRAGYTSISGADTYIDVYGVALSSEGGGSDIGGGDTPAKWDGAKTTFYVQITDMSKAFYKGSGTYAQVFIRLDTDADGEGTVKLETQLMDLSIFSWSVVVRSTGTYTYDPAAMTLTLEVDEVGTAAGGVGPESFVLHVAADKNSMTFAEEKTIRSAGLDGSSAADTYVEIKGQTMTAK